MSRTEPAVAESPADSELLRALDKALRERAVKEVADALDPALDEAAKVVRRALEPIIGLRSAAGIAQALGVRAGGSIQREATDLAYRALVQRTVEQLAPGKTDEPA